MKKSFNYVQRRIKGIAYYHHRIVMENVLGRELLPIEHVHHINGIVTDNRPENLRIVSPEEHGKLSPAPGGERNGNAKISARDVALIRKERSGGKTLAEIGSEFGISFTHVCNICRKNSWKSI
jgi:hypothetical protein